MADVMTSKDFHGRKIRNEKGEKKKHAFLLQTPPSVIHLTAQALVEKIEDNEYAELHRKKNNGERMQE